MMDAVFEYRLRRMTADDGPAAARWFIKQEPVPSDLASALPSVLSSLLNDELLRGGCVEIRTPALQTDWSLAAFGISTFVSPSVALKHFSNPPAFLDLALLDGCRRGQAANWILDLDQVAAANSGCGLHLLGLCWLQQSYDYSKPLDRKLLELGFEIMLWLHKGYRLNHAVMEGWVDYEPAFRAAGFDVLKRVAEGSPTLLPNHRSDRARLFGHYTADMARANLMGSPVSYLFEYQPPTLGLTRAQQQVITLALEDMSDAAIATALLISPNAVQMRWREIYRCFEDTKPHVFQALGRSTAEDGTARGAERRRHALGYLRNHPEELRPHTPQ